MTRIAGIRNLQRLRRGGRNEFERMAANIDIRNRLFDFGHMATNALVAGRSGSVMGMLFDRRGARPVGRIRPMALETHDACRFQKVRVVFSPVDIVTTEAGYSACIHDTRYKIVALHSILMRGVVGEVRKSSLAEFVFLQFPEIFEIETHMKSYWPVVILAANGVGQGLALRMTLEADVAGLN